MNTLLDTLLRPNADTAINPTSCIQWRYESAKAVSHVAIGATDVGGQWAENPVSASKSIGTLSYAEQLNLPGYSYAEHVARTEGEKEAEEVDFVRPSREELARYLAAYPTAVGIQDSIHTGQRVEHVRRLEHGFLIESLGIRCKHLVLASGIFTVNIPPTPLLAPIAQLDSKQDPLLVIGSGFSAADVIISTPSTRKIIHIFQWMPDTRSSPLRGCHHTAYPEYATVYRQMKLSTISSCKRPSARSPMTRRKSNPFLSQRDWASLYEGLPNAKVLSVDFSPGAGSAEVTIQPHSGETISRTVGGLEYVVGRRGSLDFLSSELRSEILGTSTAHTKPQLISGRTLRPKAECTLEVAKNVFVIGSLAGDSLIRHAVGGCVFAAGRILGHIPSTYCTSSSPNATQTTTSSSSSEICPFSTNEYVKDGCASESNGGCCACSINTTAAGGENSPCTIANGHTDLHLDRRRMMKVVEVASAENDFWANSGWWAGGLGFRRREC